MPTSKKISTAQKVYTFRMNEKEYDAANKIAIKQYGAGLASLIRVLVLKQFPEAKKKSML